MLKTIIAAILMFLMAGCAKLPPETNERLGQFTAVSSFNVRNLAYEKKEHTVAFTSGKSCYQVDPTDLSVISGSVDNLLQRAMDDAIRKGQESGIDGDLLVNARVMRTTEYKEEGTFFKDIERYECMVVEGDLVKIKTLR